MSQTVHHRLHILEASDWKDGVITLLEPRSPYRPWLHFGESRPGDYAILVLGTDPASVLTRLARIDHEGGLGGAVVGTYGADVVDLTTLAMVLDLSEADARDNVHIHTVDPLPRPAPDAPIRTPDSSRRIRGARAAARNGPRRFSTDAGRSRGLGAVAAHRRLLPR